MTRTITPAEIKPGMTIRWEGRGFIHEGLVERTTAGVYPRATRVLSGQFGMDIPEDAEVTVLTEAQPEEPTAFGARVRVRDGRFVRLDWEDSDSRPWHEKGTGYRWSWDDLCEMGPVTVIPDQGWTVPADTESAPEVPDRIEEWPENDEHLRNHEWVDYSGSIWYADRLDKWRYIKRGGTPSWTFEKPVDGPWTRETDA